MTNAPFALDRREFIALAGGLAAVLVVRRPVPISLPCRSAATPSLYLPNPVP